MTIAIISHPDCMRHENAPGHPESPTRILAINKVLRETGLESKLKSYIAPAATPEQLAGVHNSEYINSLFNAVPAEGYISLTDDTAMNAFTLKAALHAAGAVVHAVDLVQAKTVKAAYCNIRPPGHHAIHDQAMGFCFFNNIAVGAAYALNHHHLKRVAIVDFDVHNGNGTIDIFRDESRVLYCSSFQDPLFPFVSSETDSKHIFNLPMPAGTKSEYFREQFHDYLLPCVKQFDPELLFISAGFDGHVLDPLANFKLTETDFFWVTEQLVSLAKSMEISIVSSLEGGYHPEALGRSVAEHIRALLALVNTTM